LLTEIISLGSPNVPSPSYIYPKLWKNQELALNTMFCFCMYLKGDICLWDKQRSLISKAVNLEADPLAKKIGNGVSTTCS
jgi:hypothetical protein